MRYPVTTLVKAFSVLSRERLRWHVGRGTRILCGPMALLYADGAGGG